MLTLGNYEVHQPSPPPAQFSSSTVSSEISGDLLFRPLGDRKGMGRRSKVRKLGEGPETYPQPFVSDPKLEDPNQGRGRSVYLAVCRRDWSASQPYCPLYKVDVVSSGESSPRGGKTRVAKLRTDVGGKTFVPLQSRWIVGVGGDPGGTIIYDTNKRRVIRGPQLVAAKQRPAVAAVGYRVYALSSSPNYIADPDFVPWFEILDLKDAVITEKVDGSLSLDGCSWKRLPSPLCFPGKLTPMGYINPPLISVRSYVVVGHYILVSLNPPTSGTYAFDTEEHEWHKVNKEHLPFVGSATPHGHSGCIFLGLSRENGPVSAYCIRVSASSSPSSSVSTEAELSHKGGALKLSFNVLSVKSKGHEEVDAMSGHYLTSLDLEHFSTLTFELDNRKHNKIYDDTVRKLVPGKLFAKLITYQIENPEILEEVLNEEMPEVAISSQLDQHFKISSDFGFSNPPITFSLSIYK
ncbi:unnamed protein product [Urochloa decumbens]|uniref:Uncharacterized protein n=1 Tax=Urochloa decumbens TaxID=240449 RepID=A0ABC9GXH2_9POAL